MQTPCLKYSLSYQTHIDYEGHRLATTTNCITGRRQTFAKQQQWSEPGHQIVILQMNPFALIVLFTLPASETTNRSAHKHTHSVIV